MSDTIAWARNLHEERFADSFASLLYETPKPGSSATELVARAVAVALDECRLHLAAGRLGRAHDDPEPEPESESMAGGEACGGPTSDDAGRYGEWRHLLAICHSAASQAGIHMVEAGQLGLAVKALQVATDALIALHALEATALRSELDGDREEGE